MKAKKKIVSDSAVSLTVAPVAPVAPVGTWSDNRFGTMRALLAIGEAGGRSASFALSMLAAVASDRVSEKQAAAIDRMLANGEEPAPMLLLSRILNAFATLDVPGAKRFPKIRGVVDGTEVVISYVGSGSLKAKPENRGTATVASGTYGEADSKYYGRIVAGGSLVGGLAKVSPGVEAWLTGLAKDAPIVWSY